MADLDSCERAIQRNAKKAKGGDKDAKFELTVLEKLLPVLTEGGMARTVDLAKEELAAIGYLNFLTLKPTMYIANVNEDGFEDNAYLDAVREFAAKENNVVVPVCAAIESEMAELEDDEREEFLADLGIEEPGLNRVYPRRLRTTEPTNLLHSWRERSSCMDYPCWRYGTKSGSEDPHRLRKRLYPC